MTVWPDAMLDVIEPCEMDLGAGEDKHIEVQLTARSATVDFFDSLAIDCERVFSNLEMAAVQLPSWTSIVTFICFELHRADPMVPDAPFTLRREVDFLKVLNLSGMVQWILERM